jgi:serine/threonine protein phosphatase PrpC
MLRFDIPRITLHVFLMTSPKPLIADAEPRPTSTNVDVFGLTHRGRVRSENQDQFLIASLHKLLRVHQSSLPPEDITTLISESRGFILLVADGVGSRPDGQAASGTVVKTIAHHVTHLMDLYRWLDSNNEAIFVSELEKSVLKSHDVLVEEGNKEYGGRGGATTLTMVSVLWPHAYVIQVGDSRCYRLRDGRLERMTEDQTLIQALVDQGALTETEARQSPLHGLLASVWVGARRRRASTPPTVAGTMSFCSVPTASRATCGTRRSKPSSWRSARRRSHVSDSSSWRSIAAAKTM